MNKKIWDSLSPKGLEEYKNEVFNYYRTNGFPYYPTDENFRQKEFRKFMEFDVSSIIENKHIRQTMHGLALAWSFFPHAFKVKCGNMLTPYEAYTDLNIFRKVIDKRIKIGTYMSDSGIRKALRVYSGVQGVSNFRPTAACAIYKNFAKGGVVWDMSCGYGGRLLGAIKAGVKKYIGTEPDINTIIGLRQMIDMFARDIDVELIMSGSEDYIPEPESLDLCFTSPPYFRCEQYGNPHCPKNTQLQSWVRYPHKEEWSEKFLKKTFENCMVGLKHGGKIIINIANVKSFPDLELKTQELLDTVGFKYYDTLKLSLSRMCGRGIDKNKKDFKYEPVFIYVKE